MDAFLDGLHDQIATRILEMFPGPQSLFELQTIASRIDFRLSTHKQFFRFNNNNFSQEDFSFNNKPNSTNSFNPYSRRTHEPLTPEEKERRRNENLCLYCGSSEHQVLNCPLKNKTTNTNNKSSNNYSTLFSYPVFKPKSRPRLSDTSLNVPITEFSLETINSSCIAKLLLDSGSQFNLIDIYFVKENNIPFHSNPSIPKASGIDGNQTIFGKTSPITLKYKNHICKTEFYVVDLPSYCGILGIEWLTTHNPLIDFQNKKITFNSNYCLSNCLTLPNSFIVNSNKINSHETRSPSYTHTNNSKFHSNNKIPCNLFINENFCCNLTHVYKSSKSNNSFIKSVKISISDSFHSKINKSFSANNLTINKYIHTQNSKSLNNNSNFPKERVNSVVKLNSNFHENLIQTNQNSRSFKNFISNSQNFSSTNPSNQTINIYLLFQIKKKNINHFLFLVIHNSNIAKVKKKHYHFKIFKYDTFIPYEDKPPENYNSLLYTFFK